MLTIYKASAGSGKTYTLAFEYVKLLLGVKLTDGSDRYVLNSPRYVPGGRRMACRHRGILAITFTNAATEEMKSRIVRELGKLAGEGEADYRDRLVSIFGCTADELQAAASLALSEMLYDYGSFNVSTIDSFFQSVLRTFSREIDHQGDYELSLNLSDVVAQAISLMLDDLNYGRSENSARLNRWIRDYVLSRLQSGGSYNFFNRAGHMLASISASVASALGDETYTTRAEAFRRYIADPARISAFEKELRRVIADKGALIKAAAEDFAGLADGLGIPTDAYNKSFRPRIDKAIANPATLTAKDFGIGLFRMLCEEPEQKKFYVQSRIKTISHLGSSLDEVFGLACRFAETAMANIGEMAVLSEIAASLPLLEFIGMTENYMQKFLRDSNMMLISDTGELLKRIISDAELPFIYERLGMKLDSLLIDEFQDTSHLQWHNLRPLVANSIAEGHDSLIIGDEKQAIFRFRNSDSELLGHLVGERDFPDSHCLRGNIPSENTNYRSAGAIVRFNNTLFRRMARNLKMDCYGNVVQSLSAKNADIPAFIRLQFVDGCDEEARNDIFERMAVEINRQHAAGYRWRDILILVRARDEAKAIAEYLMYRHPEIRLLSSEALMLNSSVAVRSIIGMLKLVERSYRVLSEVGERRPQPYASKADVVMMISRFAYYRGEGFGCSEALELALGEASEAGGSLQREVLAIRAENPANLVALIEAVIAHKIPAAQRKAEYAYIAALQDLAVKHCESADPSLASFLAEYDRNIDNWSIKASSKLDAVEIMSVHKSKGLERACVHMPLADWKLRRKTDDLWLPLDNGLPGFDRDIVPPLLRVTTSKNNILRTSPVSPFAEALEQNERDIDADNLNLAYVAYTRASRELLIYSGVDNIGSWFAEALQQPDDESEHSDPALMPLSEFYNAESGTFEYGAPTSRKSEEANVEDVDVSAGEYQVICRDDARELTAIDDLLGDDPDIGGEELKEITDDYADGLMAEAARRGQNLHAVLASVRTRADLPEAVNRLALRLGLGPEESEGYLQELEEAFSNAGETAEAWFRPENKIFAERAIYLPTTGETFRPDRVVVTPDGCVTVVDYKFTTEAREGHRRQVELYISLLRRMGREKVDGFLWYPLLGLIIKV